MSLLDEVNKYRMKHPPDLLEIYDDDSLLMSHNAWARTGLDLYQLGIKNGKDGLIKSLDKLLLEHKTFKRVLFNTHGNEGMILFKNQPIDAAWLKGLRGRRYERLFLFPKTRMYFAGCNVAEGTRGWNFLEAAGQTFLRIGGGVVFASTGGSPLCSGLDHYYRPYV